MCWGSLMPAQVHTRSLSGYFAFARPIPDLSFDGTGRSSEQQHRLRDLHGRPTSQKRPSSFPSGTANPKHTSIKYLISLKVINIYHVLYPHSSD